MTSPDTRTLSEAKIAGDIGEPVTARVSEHDVTALKREIRAQMDGKREMEGRRS